MAQRMQIVIGKPQLAQFWANTGKISRQNGHMTMTFLADELSRRHFFSAVRQALQLLARLTRIQGTKVSLGFYCVQ
jgi:hypothetical protein